MVEVERSVNISQPKGASTVHEYNVMSLYVSSMLCLARHVRVRVICTKHTPGRSPNRWHHGHQVTISVP